MNDGSFQASCMFGFRFSPRREYLIAGQGLSGLAAVSPDVTHAKLAEEGPASPFRGSVRTDGFSSRPHARKPSEQPVSRLIENSVFLRGHRDRFGSRLLVRSLRRTLSKPRSESRLAELCIAVRNQRSFAHMDAVVASVRV